MEEKILLEVSAKIDRTALNKTLDELKADLKKAKEVMGKEPINSKSFVEAASNVKNLSESIKLLEDAAKSVDNPLKGINKSAAVTKGSMNELRQNSKQLREELNNLVIGSEAYNNKLKEFNDNESRLVNERMKQKSLFQERVKAAISEVPVIGQLINKYDSLNDVMSAASANITNYFKGIKDAGSATDGAKVAIQGLGGAMKLLPIVALIAAFSSLVSFFTATAEGADKLTEIFTGLKTVFTATVKELAYSGKSLLEGFKELGTITVQLGKATKEAITGDFEAAKTSFNIVGDAADRAGNAFKKATIDVSQLSSRMKLAYQEGSNYAKVLDEIEDREKVQALIRSNAAVDIMVLEKSAKNRTLSEEERIALLNKAAKLEKENFAIEKQIVEDRLEALKGNLAFIYKIDKARITSSEILNNLTDKDRDALIKAAEAVNSKRLESEALQVKIENRLAALRAEVEADKNKKLEDELKQREAIRNAIDKQNQESSETAQRVSEANLEALERIKDLELSLIEDRFEREAKELELAAERRKQFVRNSVVDEEIAAQEIALIDKELTAKREANNKARAESLITNNQKEIQSELAKQRAFETTANAVVQGISALGNLMGSNNEFQKATALFQIAANMATAISAAVTQSAANPLNATTFGGAGAAQFAAMTAQILTGIAQAKQVLVGPPQPTYFEGGYTTATGGRDHTGARVAGIVHENEYVIPSRLINQPDIAAMVNSIEARRTYKGSNYIANMTSNNNQLAKVLGAMPAPVLNITSQEKFLAREAQIKRLSTI